MNKVDIVCGVGYDRIRRSRASAGRYHELRVVITEGAVMDFTAEGRLCRRSVHPDVSVAQVQEATGFPLEQPESVPITRVPNQEELRLIREVIDPRRTRDREVPPS